LRVGGSRGTLRPRSTREGGEMSLFSGNWERTPVRRLSIEADGATHLLIECFITVDQDARTLPAWESREAEHPLLSAPMESAVIEWNEVPRRPPPQWE